MSSSTPTVTVEPGAAAVYNLAITPTNGDFNSVVTLSASGFPAGATVSFAPASVTPGGSATPSVMTVQTVRQEAQMATPRRWGWIPATTAGVLRSAVLVAEAQPLTVAGYRAAVPDVQRRRDVPCGLRWRLRS